MKANTYIYEVPEIKQDKEKRNANIPTSIYYYICI